MLCQVLIAVLLLFIHKDTAALGAGENLEQLYVGLNKYYDYIRPPLSKQYSSKVPTPVEVASYHARRCSHTDPGASVALFRHGAYESVLKGEPVLVGSPCLHSESLGNFLSNYFESILCANASRLHYVAVAMIWEPHTNDTGEPFLTKLPTMIQHPTPVARADALASLKASCPCDSLCHERSRALWTRSRDTIKRIMWEAMNHHRAVRQLTNTTVLSTDQSNRPPGTVLPFVPEVAIHYRCGDNFVEHYGFLPFSAFSRLVPAGARTIFVLAENRSRKTFKSRLDKCDAIFAALLNFLRKQFPAADVVIRRGDDLYSDLIRLASAATTICSVSTFCLWPAYVNPHQAYFPLTKLVARRDASVNLGFKWIVEPKILSGLLMDNSPTNFVLKKLLTM